MRVGIAALLTVSAITAAGCGGGGKSSDPPAPPTTPSVPTPQPAAVNIGGGDDTPIVWTGQASDTEGGTGTVRLALSQTGARVTGNIVVQVLSHSGPLVGTVSGNTLTFNFSVGNSGAGCGNAITGTAIVSSVNQMIAPPNNTTNTMTATFSGKDCDGRSVTNGAFTASLPTSDIQSLSATRFPVAGTWMGLVGPLLGGGSWTWTIAQDGDVNGGNLTGSVSVSADNTLHLGTGTITGTVTNIFPGGPQMVSAVTTVSFTGACPTTLMLNWGSFAGDGRQWGTNSVSGSVCNGAVPQFKPTLKRQ